MNSAEYAAPASLLDGVEAATAYATVVAAGNGCFVIAGKPRTTFLVGPRTTPLDVAYDVDRCREWRLPAWMVRPLFHVGANEVVGGIFDVVDLPQTGVRRALTHLEHDDQAGSAVSVAARTALADWPAGGHAGTRLAVAAWSSLRETRGQVRVHSLATSLGIGVRRLQQAFRAETGLTVKTATRLVRFGEALTSVREDRGPLASIAIDAGYSDQAHMTREFQAFAMMTPGRVRQQFRTS